jgi:hypothetical protein
MNTADRAKIFWRESPSLRRAEQAAKLDVGAEMLRCGELKRDQIWSDRRRALDSSSIGHDLFGKPLHTFRIIRGCASTKSPVAWTGHRAIANIQSV